MHLLEGAAAALRGFFLLCDALIVASAALGSVAMSRCPWFSRRLWRLVRQVTSRVVQAGCSLVTSGVAVPRYVLTGLVRRRWLFFWSVWPDGPQ